MKIKPYQVKEKKNSLIDKYFIVNKGFFNISRAVVQKQKASKGGSQKLQHKNVNHPKTMLIIMRRSFNLFDSFLKDAIYHLLFLSFPFLFYNKSFCKDSCKCTILSHAAPKIVSLIFVPP